MTLLPTLKHLITSLSLPLALYGCASMPPPATNNTINNNDLAAMRADMQTMKADIAEIKSTLNTFYKLVSSKIPQDEPPKPIASEINLDSDRILGNHLAKVGIVEFSDYQCPFCLAFQTNVMPLLKSQYIDTGKVQFMYRDYPLDIHPQAESAAIAALCAGRQNAYWQMHDQLFENQNQLGPDLYKELAQQLRLDAKAFDSCLSDAKRKDQVVSEETYGQQVGVDGTPTFFIGHIVGNKLVDIKPIVGAQPPEVFAQVIDTYLK
jgi:protein-disulfide isomerase